MSNNFILENNKEDSTLSLNLNNQIFEKVSNENSDLSTNTSYKET